MKNLVAMAQKAGNERQVWLTNEKFAELASKTKVGLNQVGNVVFQDNDVEVQISVRESLSSKSGNLFARVEEIYKISPYTHIKKVQLFVSPDYSPEEEQPPIIIL